MIFSFYHHIRGRVYYENVMVLTRLVFGWWLCWQAIRYQWPILLRLSLIPTWINDYTHYKMWDGITYPFPNFNDATVGNGQVISSQTLLSTWFLPILWLQLNRVSKRAPGFDFFYSSPCTSMFVRTSMLYISCNIIYLEFYFYCSAKDTAQSSHCSQQPNMHQSTAMGAHLSAEKVSWYMITTIVLVGVTPSWECRFIDHNNPLIRNDNIRKIKNNITMSKFHRTKYVWLNLLPDNLVDCQNKKKGLIS